MEEDQMTFGTNIFDHVVDDASTVTLFKDTTAFSSDNVQSALEEIDQHALLPLPDYPVASETQAGIIKIATEIETLDDTNDLVAITPAKLKYWQQNQGLATETNSGTISVASNTDMEVGTNDAKCVTPKKLEYYINTVKNATETQAGFAKLSTQLQAEAGVDDTTVMTPLKTYNSIQTWASGSDSSASETVKGLIRIATTTEVNNDSLDNLAITPYNLGFRTATTTRKGAFYVPTSTEAAARASNDHAVTAGTLSLFQATETLAGVARIANNLTTDDPSFALSAAMGKKLSDEKLDRTGGEVTGTVKLTNINRLSDNKPLMVNGLFTSESLLNMYPVDSIYISVSSANPGTIFGGTWESFGQGRVLLGAGSGSDDRGDNRTFNVGDTGGEYSHQLTIDEIPSHQHAGWGDRFDPNWPWGNRIASKYGMNRMGSSRTDYDNYLYNSEPIGDDQPHNNMMPYIAVYMWKRTA